MKLYIILTFLVFQISHGSVESNYLLQKNKFLKKEVQNRNILSELYQAQMSIRKLHHDKSKIKQKVDNAQRSIDKIAPVVDKAESSLMSQKIQIQKRLMYILKFQDMSFLKIIFSSQTPSQMDRNLRILKGLTEVDYINLKSYFQNVKALIFKKKELVTKKEDLQKLLKELDLKEQELVSKTQEKNEMLAKLDKQQKNLIKELRKIRQENKNLTAERREFLNTILEPLFFERRGSLRMPMDGKVIQGYGVLEHPIYKTQFRHKGVFIKPSSSQFVKSVAKGRVSYIGEMPGLGMTLILDHGDHYFSIYSHIKNIEFNVGDTIEEGQTFARVGLPNPFLGEGLYFELRHFSEPVDPQDWFIRKVARR